MSPPRAWVVIDGYSLVHRDAAAAPVHRSGRLAEGRRRVIARLERIAPQLGDRVTLVFDGRDPGGPDTESPPGPVEVVFTPSNRSADAWIERLASEHAATLPMLVVTSDRLERTSAAAAGAETMGCGDFLDWCETIERGLAAAARRVSGPTPRFTIGHLLESRPGR